LANYYYASPYGGQTSYYASGMFGPQLYLSDERIKKNIENAFFWSPFVHSDKSRYRLTGNGHLDWHRRNLDRVG